MEKQKHKVAPLDKSELALTEDNPLAIEENKNSLVELEDILSENSYEEEMERLKKDMAHLDNVYDRLSKHTMNLIDKLDNATPDDNAPKRLGAADSKPKRGPSPTYVASQFTNMVSVKSLTLSYLKQMKDLKDSRLDRATKIISQIKKNGDGSEGFSEAEIFKYLMSISSQNKKKPISASAGEVIDVYTEDEIEDLMDSRLEGIDEIPTGQEYTTSAEHIKNDEIVEVISNIPKFTTLYESLEEIPVKENKFIFYLELSEDDDIEGAHIINKDYDIIYTLDLEVENIELSYDEKKDKLMIEGFEGVEVRTDQDEEDE